VEVFTVGEEVIGEGVDGVEVGVVEVGVFPWVCWLVLESPQRLVP